MTFIPWGFFLLFVVLAVGLGAYGLWQQKKRTEAWQRVAGELGIAFLGEANDVLARYGHFQTFSRGRNRRLRNAIQGDSGDVRITIGDFRYRTGSGKNSHTYHRTVCVLQSPRLRLPRCYLRPESMLFDSLGSLFGGQDIDFADDREFSGSYVLQGDSEQAIRELFDADVRAWFAGRQGRNFHFEGQGDALIFHTRNRRKPDEAKDLMQQALEIMNRLAKG